MILPSITFLDLETTGATPIKDRITEIALVRFDDGVETARWETLVNPQQSIPPFIQQLTGIDNDMVAQAPTFAEVADILLAFLEGSVLSAHNVRFDHGFIKAEFNRLGITIRQKVLCTVKLSRLLYPAFPSHGLDAIMQRHNITSIARHRAMGDVESVLAFLKSAKSDLGEARVNTTASQLLRGPTLPPHLNAQYLEDMPESPGVYLFFGENNLPLYIGKSNHIRSRVLAHFSRDHASAKEMRISQAVKHIEWIDAAGEFSALLLEAQLVKEKQPLHNKQLRQERQLCTWLLQEDNQTMPLLSLIDASDIKPALFHRCFGTFKSKRQARETLRQLVDLHKLCPKMVGLEIGKGACFAVQIKRCKGVCCGKEHPEMHYKRLVQALNKHQLKPWPYAGKIAIKEQNALNGLTQLHVFDHWHYLGAVHHEQALSAFLNVEQPFKFELDIYRLLIRQLEKSKTVVLAID